MAIIITPQVQEIPEEIEHKPRTDIFSIQILDNHITALVIKFSKLKPRPKVGISYNDRKSL
jgi:hypothetical protein